LSLSHIPIRLAGQGVGDKCIIDKGTLPKLCKSDFPEEIKQILKFQDIEKLSGARFCRAPLVSIVAHMFLSLQFFFIGNVNEVQYRIDISCLGRKLKLTS